MSCARCICKIFLVRINIFVHNLLIYLTSKFNWQRSPNEWVTIPFYGQSADNSIVLISPQSPIDGSLALLWFALFPGLIPCLWFSGHFGYGQFHFFNSIWMALATGQLVIHGQLLLFQQILFSIDVFKPFLVLARFALGCTQKTPTF
jgi:hypothetical protein